MLTDLKIDTSALAPKATTLIDQGINLNSEADIIPLPTATPPLAGEVAFDPADDTTYTKSFPTKVYDSQGNEHTMEQFYRKTGTNQWTMYTLIDGRNPLDPTSTTPLQGNITFNSDGTVASMAAQAVTPPTA